MGGTVSRGDVIWIDLRGAEGTEKEKERPCLVVQNDVGNRHSPLTIVVPLTDIDQFKSLPVQVLVPAPLLGAWQTKDSVVECGHVRTVDVAVRATSKVVGHANAATMAKVDVALKVSLGLK